MPPCKIRLLPYHYSRHPPYSHFSKRKRRLEFAISKPPSVPQGRFQRSCCMVRMSAGTICYQKKRADNPRLMANGLSALRLCVWLFDNFRIELFYIYQSFLFTLRAIKREIFQYCIRAQLNSGFIFANRTEQPFHFTCTRAI